MAKFKVGDRVRVIVDGWCSDSGHNAQAGDVYVVTAVDGEGVNTNLWWFANHEVEPVAPQLAIRAVHYYRTRDGQKVGPMERSGTWFDDEYQFTVSHYFDSDDFGKAWRKDGTFNPFEERHHPADLIAEWVDDPAVEGTKFKVGDRVKFVDDYNSPSRGKEAIVVKLNVWGEGKGVQVDQGGKWGISTEPAHSLRLVAPATSGKRNFRKGDRVRCLENYPHQFTAGKIYTVSRDHEGREYESVSVELDDNGSTSNGWNPDKFELVTPAPAIVALIENGQPKPATRPFVHSDKWAAQREAKRLAGRYPGKEFGVYELVDTAKEARVYEHEWQRLASGGRKIDAIKRVRAATGFTLKGAKDAVEHWLAVEAA